MRQFTHSRYVWLVTFVAVATSVIAPWAGSDTKEVWFAVTNLGIMAGYIFVATSVAPFFRVDFDTKVGAILFFATCATTHLELALHTLYDTDGFSKEDLTSWHMMIIHTVQVTAIWRFVLGLRKAAIIDRQRLQDLTKREANVSEQEAKRVADEAYGNRDA